MSLWDASELDQVGGDREVIPKFINLSDAAIHMVCFLRTIAVNQR